MIVYSKEAIMHDQRCLSKNGEGFNDPMNLGIKHGYYMYNLMQSIKTLKIVFKVPNPLPLFGTHICERS